MVRHRALKTMVKYNVLCAMCVRRRLFRVCILPLTACLPLWAGEMRVRRSKTSRVEMKVDYLSLCYRGSDNPAFIWFCDFLSKASRLSCDYQSRFGLASTKDSEVRHRALKTMVKYNVLCVCDVCAMCVL